jgi:hypothetical protein
MQKNIQNTITELSNLKNGITKHATQWTGLPVTEVQITAAITALTTAGKNISDAEDALKQARLAGRLAVETNTTLINQATSLAEGLHTNEQEKLVDYGFSITAARSSSSIPTKTIIESITDDADGVGFVIKLQAVANADGYEIEKSNPSDSTLTVLAPPYNYLKNTAKLITVDDEVLKGKRYFYRVRAYNRKGYGEWSEPVSRVQ